MDIQEFIKKIQDGSISASAHTQQILDEAVVIGDEYHYFNALSSKRATDQASDVEKRIAAGEQLPLAGVPISVKDNICVKDIETTAGSRILKGYKPVFDATVIKKCIDAGAVIIGKTSQDEFGFGGFNTNTGVDFPRPVNPFDQQRACGGSSGGAAGWTQKTSFVHAAIAESTGGSIVNPASFCGVVGLCPTYGRVSRYGLVDYANSLDKIGPMAKTVADAATILQYISGHDLQDSTSVQQDVPTYVDAVNHGVDGLRVGVLKEGFGEGVETDVKNQCNAAIKKLEDAGATLVDISLPFTMQHVLPAYYILAMTEASTNLAKYCGMRYGAHEELGEHFNTYFGNVREKNLGEEAKRRIILGTFARMTGFRDAYYIKAAQVRTKIINEYLGAFKDVDLIASPTMPFIAPTFNEIEQLTPLQNYMADILTVGPNLAGLPHMNMPCGTSQEMPVGLLLMSNHFKEQTLFNAGGILE